MRNLLRWWALASLSWASAAGATASCTDILPERRPPVAVTARTITSVDLVRIRDIGRSGDPVADPSALAVSPDGSRVAFQLRRADPTTNSYCLAIVVLAIMPGATPQIIDVGGELIRGTFNNNGLLDFPSGVPALITPRWSLDGKWVAYLKKVDGGTVQVWRASVDGRTSEQVTHSDVNVDAFGWSTDGTDIIYSSRPEALRAVSVLAGEARVGYQYDDRFSPMAAGIPFPDEPIAEKYFLVNVRSGATTDASALEQRVLDPPGASTDIPGVRLQIEGRGGMRAWTVDPAPFDPGAPVHLYATLPNGRTTQCTDNLCKSEIVGLWSQSTHSLLYLRREGVTHSSYALYRWRPRRTLVRVASMEGLLAGCQQFPTGLICEQETSTIPRRLVMLDGSTGQLQVVFDPNPEFRSIRLGSVQRLHWTNKFGMDAFGDLVLPPGHRSGESHPLIVVQYQSRGFLRGGTGDEYPIQLFAAHGFAVLSFNRPRDFGEVPEATDDFDIERRNLVGWADRRSVLDSLEEGIRLAIATGNVDPARIGITGFSDGAATVQFALANSRMFKAAALSSCCLGPSSIVFAGGHVARVLQKAGYPGVLELAPDFWKPVSLSANAGSIVTPILMQLSDDEYLLALPDYESLRAAGRSVEMYVFPNEHHFKWQPSHRKAIYDRTVAWFASQLQTTAGADQASGTSR